MTDLPAGSIDRRAALRRVALLLGGALSAPAIAGVLAGCERHDRAAAMTKASLCLALSLAACFRPSPASRSRATASREAMSVAMSDTARRYLGAALDTLQRTVLGTDTLPWSRIRDST